MPFPTIEPYTIDELPLPASDVAWDLDLHRSALLIHDMQEYFTRFLDRARDPYATALRNCCALLDGARRAGVPVLFSAQPGRMTPLDRGLLADVWGPGMSGSPLDTAIVPDLEPRAGEVVLTKWRYSAFARSDLARRLHDAGRDQLIICGIYAHVGCLMTAVDAFSADVEPFFVADAVADFDSDYHALALRYVAKRCGSVVTTEHVCSRLTVAAAGLAASAAPSIGT